MVVYSLVSLRCVSKNLGGASVNKIALESTLFSVKLSIVTGGAVVFATTAQIGWR